MARTLQSYKNYKRSRRGAYRPSNRRNNFLNQLFAARTIDRVSGITPRQRMRMSINRAAATARLRQTRAQRNRVAAQARLGALRMRGDPRGYR